MSHKLAEILALTEVSRAGADRITYRARMDPVFTIGPKVHGGSLQMVVANAARRALVDLAPDHDAAAADGKIPVAITSDYLSAPDAADVDLEITVRKRGRTVTVMTVDAVQNGRTMVSSSVTCARPDTGAPHHSAPSVLDDTPADPAVDGIGLDNSPMAEVNHLGPALDLVLDPTTFPVARGETGEPTVRGWARPKGAESDIDFAVLVCDISPPVVMNLALFGWAPTVQLTTYVRRHPAPGWLRFAATSTEVGPGMFEEDHLVVDSTGTVVAQSRQLALIPQRS
ncbi:thioesterase family protein [Gordonia sp. HNM0687]|uniref:Thioesterase family protein n=1 Tax=Gordonia mangrovi TaxID=2665643 RepID=A0A6L7GKW5_9ACTN|nr:thioesterase family protein [Gordonia mangrovi]MDY6809378.1 thioesterase family protein [Actinomycetota bacterium]MXP20037.1 thioesterase family protein [Gordonia mangrovi]UVF79349.1 thioesterase family protein [Gordonia mangrovi]